MRCAHLRGLFDIEPALVAHDVHPDYLSTKYAPNLDGVVLLTELSDRPSTAHRAIGALLKVGRVPPLQDG